MNGTSTTAALSTPDVVIMPGQDQVRVTVNDSFDLAAHTSPVDVAQRAREAALAKLGGSDWTMHIDIGIDDENQCWVSTIVAVCPMPSQGAL